MEPHKHQSDIDEALQFALSIRGRYIIAQALNYGVKELSKVPSPRKEVSNIADMEYLRKMLFTYPQVLFERQEVVTKGVTNG